MCHSRSLGLVHLENATDAKSALHGPAFSAAAATPRTSSSEHEAAAFCLALLRFCFEAAAAACAAPAGLGLGGAGAGLKAPSASEKALMMYPGVALARCGGSGTWLRVGLGLRLGHCQGWGSDMG